MKVQQINEFGAPDVFHAADIEPRTPGPRQIRVRQMATSVNPVDTKLRAAGRYQAARRRSADRPGLAGGAGL